MAGTTTRATSANGTHPPDRAPAGAVPGPRPTGGRLAPASGIRAAEATGLGAVAGRLRALRSRHSE